MRVTSSFAVLLLLALATSPVAPSSGVAQRAPEPAGFVVIVESIRNDRGLVIGGIYDRAATWLGEDRSIEDCHAPIHHGRARCVFHVPVTGAVAFAGLHDEDDDGELDRDLIGLPTEGYAFSNDVREPLGPPSFGAASFAPSGVPLVVHMRYGI